MKSIILEEFGNTEVLKLSTNNKIPSINKNQILVENYSAAINPHDLYLRAGYLSPILGENFPITPGLDIAGKVIAVGENVNKFNIGDRVYGMMDANPEFAQSGFAQTGAYAEYIVTREDTLSIIPENLTFDEAASIPLVGLTAYQALIKKVKAKKEQKLLINGASGGVGSIAIQIANQIQLETTAVCHSTKNDFVSSLNPTSILHYDKEDFTASKMKFDIIFDVVGNKSFELCEQNLSENGIYISNVPTESTFKAYQNRSQEEKYGFNSKNMYNWVIPLGEDLDKISELIGKGIIKPLVNKVFNLEEVTEAHNYAESGIATGKIVLSIKKDNINFN